MRTRTRIHPYVTRDLAARLNAYSAARGITESATVEAALEGYLDGGEKDHEVIIRRLDRLGRAAGRQQRDLEVLSEAFALFVRFWAAYLPDLSEVDTEAAKRRGVKYYEGFLAHLSERLASSSRLVKSVVPEESRQAETGSGEAKNSAERAGR